MSKSWAGSAVGASSETTTRSTSRSTESASFVPPRANSLMPLSRYGLCDAEITAPITLRRWHSNATTGVGTTPRRWATTPSLASPATKAASSMAVDTRVSPPTTASHRPSPMGASTRAAARPRSRANDAVRSRLATPRTPSVPNFTATAGSTRPTSRSALGELLGLAGLDETVLLALLLPCVTGEQAGLLQGGARLGLHFGERAGEGHAHRPGLATDATTVDRRVDVVALGGIEQPQRLDGLHAMSRRGEVRIERATVDGEHAGARTQPGAGDRLLATAGGLGERGGGHESRVSGFSEVSGRGRRRWRAAPVPGARAGGRGRGRTSDLWARARRGGR